MRQKTSQTGQAFVLKLDDDDMQRNDSKNTSGRVDDRRPSSGQASESAVMMAKLHELAVHMEAMRDELRGQRDLLSRLIPKVVTEDDRVILSRLLPPVAARYGSSAWPAKEVASDSTFKTLIGNRSAGSLGKLLARNQNCNVDGFSIVRITHESGRTLWAVWESITL